MRLDVISAKEIAIKLNANSFERKNVSFSDLKNIFDDDLVDEDATSKTNFIKSKLREINDFEYRGTANISDKTPSKE